MHPAQVASHQLSPLWEEGAGSRGQGSERGSREKPAPMWAGCRKEVFSGAAQGLGQRLSSHILGTRKLKPHRDTSSLLMQKSISMLGGRGGISGGSVNWCHVSRGRSDKIYHNYQCGLLTQPLT